MTNESDVALTRLSQDDLDQIYILSEEFYLQFSSLCNQFVRQVPEHARVDLEVRLQEKASVFGRLDNFFHPIPMLIWCPRCGAQHIDMAEPAQNWNNPPHRSHTCARCKTIFRVADVETTGVEKIQTKGKADTYVL